jgi:molecular chaperone GrpE
MDKRRTATGRAPDEARGPEEISGPQVVPGDVAGGADEPAAAATYLDDLRRLQAEFENYRKRVMKDQASIAERSKARLLERLLPVLDNFERAMSHGEGGPGVKLVFKDLKETLAAEGLEEIPAEGVAFDPRIHEAVESTEDASLSEPTCVTRYRTGYRLGEKVLRPAMVVVARPPEGSVLPDAAVATGSDADGLDHDGRGDAAPS